MPAYAAAIPRPPRTLTGLDQAALLKVTGEHRDGFREHVIFAVALGTGLREHEIAVTAARRRVPPWGCARCIVAGMARSGRVSADEWRKRVEAWHASGESAQRFARSGLFGLSAG